MLPFTALIAGLWSCNENLPSGPNTFSIQTRIVVPHGLRRFAAMLHGPGSRVALRHVLHGYALHDR